MADFNAAHRPPSLHARRRAAGLDSTMAGTLLHGDRTTGLADRARDYDYALRQSQHAAAWRSQGGSKLGVSGAAAAAASSVFGGVSTAQTAVLGDSHGSVGPAEPAAGARGEGIPEEDLAADGGVWGGLEGSYVDGTTRAKPYLQHDGGDEDVEALLEDGGVLGLLAQIYGTRGQRPARGI